MRIEYTRCPVCDSSGISELARAPKFPAILFPIDASNRNNVRTHPLLAMGCDACDHMFLQGVDTVFNQRLYSDYYHLYPYSNLESMSEAYRKPFERAFDFAVAVGNLPGNALLEVGCTADAQLDIFRAAGFECTGISPGADVESGKHIIDGFYEANAFKQPFDCIVSRFNLEHIIDLKVFLTKAYNELTDGGLLVVQVPNVQSFLNSGILGVFAHEHPHYFSRKSLFTALECSGFTVELIQADVLSPSIIAVARKRINRLSNLDRVASNLQLAETALSILSEESESTLAFYGAGLTLCTLLYADERILRHEARMIVIDDNVALAGKYMPNTNLKLMRLDSVADPQQTVLFIFLNSVYHERVVPRAKALGFKKIFYVARDGIQQCH